MERAVITVIGKDTVGITAAIANTCADFNINIVDISQKVLDELFTMIMLVDISKSKIPFTEFVDKLTALGKDRNLEIHTMHENIFNSMHRI